MTCQLSLEGRKQGEVRVGIGGVVEDGERMQRCVLQQVMVRMCVRLLACTRICTVAQECSCPLLTTMLHLIHQGRRAPWIGTGIVLAPQTLSSELPRAVQHEHND